MDLKFFFCLFAVFAAVTASPIPEEELKFEPIELEEMAPPKLMFAEVMCLEGDDSCDKINAEAKKNLDTQRLEALQGWIDRMGPKAKQNWQQNHPEEAAEYEQLKG